MEVFIEPSFLSEDIVNFLDQIDSGELTFVGLGKRKRDDQGNSMDEHPTKMQKCDQVATDTIDDGHLVYKDEDTSLEYSLSEDGICESDSTPNEQIALDQVHGYQTLDQVHGYQTLDQAVSQFNFAPITVSNCKKTPTTGWTQPTAKPRKQKRIIDLTKYFRMTQQDAALHIGVSPSQLSTAWKSIKDRPTEQWPYTSLKQIEYRVTCIIQQFAYQQRHMETEVSALARLSKAAPPALALDFDNKIKQIQLRYAGEAARLSIEYAQLTARRDVFTKPFLVQLECKVQS